MEYITLTVLLVLSLAYSIRYIIRAIVTVNECNCDNCAIDCERKRRPQKRLV
ncbi:MAG: hypothetical protein KBG92_11255 [Spirochaetes bacterium]|nr:hypothetical protein [Spirochaetota bacterium]MBP8988374.1 hypothetical protein [Spirochaetota bacterium]